MCLTFRLWYDAKHARTSKTNQMTKTLRQSPKKQLLQRRPFCRETSAETAERDQSGVCGHVHHSVSDRRLRWKSVSSHVLGSWRCASRVCNVFIARVNCQGWLNTVNKPSKETHRTMHSRTSGPGCCQLLKMTNTQNRSSFVCHLCFQCEHVSICRRHLFLLLLLPRRCVLAASTF